MTTAVEVRTHRPLGEIAKDIRAACKRIQEGMSRSVGDAIEIGHELIRARQRVAHTEWRDWIKKNTPMGYAMARRYMQLARELPEMPESKRSRASSLGVLSACKLLAEVNAESFLTNPEKAEQKIVDAAKDGKIPETKAATLVDDLCELRREIKNNGTPPTTAGTSVKKALKDAIGHHARTPEQRSRVEAIDLFLSVIKKGRAFNDALLSLVGSPHELDRKAAFLFLSTIWTAQMTLAQVASKHRKALADVDDATLKQLSEVEDVRAELA